jgi:hypothetical protein
MSGPRKKMYGMAEDNDIAGITRVLDEGVDPAAFPERYYGVRPRDDPCLSMVPFLDCLLGCHGRVADDTLQNATALHCAADKGLLPLARLLVERAPHLLEEKDSVSGCVRQHVGVLCV